MSCLRICLRGRQENSKGSCSDAGGWLGSVSSPSGLGCAPPCCVWCVPSAGSHGVTVQRCQWVFYAAGSSFIWPIKLCAPVSKYRGEGNMNLALSHASVLRSSLWCHAMLVPIKPRIASSLLKLVSEPSLFIPKKRLNQIVFH